MAGTGGYADPRCGGDRKSLGSAVVIGLEILVAATILRTITAERTADSVGLLATMIAIRTIPGGTTTLGISGR